MAKKAVSFFLSFLLLLSCCLFSASAATYDTLELLHIILYREVTEAGITTPYAYDYTIETYGGNSSLYAIKPDDHSFWNSGGVKVIQSVFLDNLAAGHEYELEFSAGRNFNAIYDICVKVAGKIVYESTVSSQGADFYSISFTAPDAVTDLTSVDIMLEIPSQYNIGGEGSSFQSAAFLFSKTIEFTDRTDEPGWLGKILQRFTDLGDTIGSFFTNLGNKIGGFFTDLKDSLVQKFVDLMSLVTVQESEYLPLRTGE